jgi:hypothetical protein
LNRCAIRRRRRIPRPRLHPPRDFRPGGAIAQGGRKNLAESAGIGVLYCLMWFDKKSHVV